MGSSSDLKLWLIPVSKRYDIKYIYFSIKCNHADLGTGYTGVTQLAVSDTKLNMECSLFGDMFINLTITNCTLYLPWTCMYDVLGNYNSIAMKAWFKKLCSLSPVTLVTPGEPIDAWTICCCLRCETVWSSSQPTPALNVCISCR